MGWCAEDGWCKGGCAEGQCGCGFREDRRRKMRRGDTLQFSITVLLNPQTGEYGSAWPGESFPPNTAPVNLTGWRVIFTAKYELPDWDNMAVAQLDNEMIGGVVTPDTGGAVQVTMPAQATMCFADGATRLVYDVECIDPSGNVHTPETGKLVVHPDVTRAT